jgi:hypothetical protein
VESSKVKVVKKAKYNKLNRGVAFAQQNRAALYLHRLMTLAVLAFSRKATGPRGKGGREASFNRSFTSLSRRPTSAWTGSST